MYILYYTNRREYYYFLLYPQEVHQIGEKKTNLDFSQYFYKITKNIF